MSYDHDATMVIAAARRAPVIVTDDDGGYVTTGTLVAWRPCGRNGSPRYEARVNDGYVTRTYRLNIYDIEVVG